MREEEQTLAIKQVVAGQFRTGLTILASAVGIIGVGYAMYSGAAASYEDESRHQRQALQTLQTDVAVIKSQQAALIDSSARTAAAVDLSIGELRAKSTELETTVRELKRSVDALRKRR